MNDKCEIVRDLMPLYVDGVCSNTSKELVENHIEECAECEAEYKKLVDQSVNISVSDDDTQAIKKAGKKLKKDRKKSVLKGVAITLAAVILLSGLLFPDIMVKLAKTEYTRCENIDMKVYNHADGKVKIGNLVRVNLPEQYQPLQAVAAAEVVTEEDSRKGVISFSFTDPNTLRTTTNQFITVNRMEEKQLNFSMPEFEGWNKVAKIFDARGVKELGFGENDYYEFLNYLYKGDEPKYSFFSSLNKKSAAFAFYNCSSMLLPLTDRYFTFETDSYKCYGYILQQGFDGEYDYTEPAMYVFYLYDKGIEITVKGFTKYEAEYIMSSLVFE